MPVRRRRVLACVHVVLRIPINVDQKRTWSAKATAAAADARDTLW